MPTSEPEILDLAGLTDEAFERLYASRLAPLLEAREGERRKRVADFRFHAMLAVPVAIVAACLTWLAARDAEPTVFIGLGAAAITIALAAIPISQLHRTVKIEMLEAICAAIGARYRPEADERPGFDRCLALGLAPRHDRAAFEDLFHGEREGCAFDLYEAHLEVERRGRNGQTHHDTVFRGQIIRIAFPKAFLGVTVVKRDAGFFNALQGSGDLKRVGLVDPKFERLFEVFSNDQVEARALVHPVFMERLMEIEQAFQGGKVRCAFEGGRLLVMVEGRNKFEPGSMFTPLTDPKRARRVVDDIARVLRLMDAVLTAELAPLVALRAERAEAAARAAARSAGQTAAQGGASAPREGPWSSPTAP